MPLDLSDSQPQREFGDTIPDGTFCKLVMTIRPGGWPKEPTPGIEPIDMGLFKASAPPKDTVYLDCEFTVVAGSYQHRKVFQNFTVRGGKLDEKGNSKAWNITKDALRAMIDSALGLDPKDESPATKQRRIVRGFKDFDGMPIYAKIGVEEGNEIQGQPGKYYPDKNTLERVVVPGDDEYADLVAGKDVPPKPRKRRETTGVASSAPSGQRPSSGPAWAQPAAQPTLPGTGPAVGPSTVVTDKPAWLR